MDKRKSYSGLWDELNSTNGASAVGTNTAGQSVQEKLDSVDGEIATTNANLATTNNNLTAANTKIATHDTMFVESTGYGVVQGLKVSAQTVPDMSVKVSSGVVHMPDGKRFAIDSIASIAVSTAHALMPRIDLIYKF